MCVTPSMTPCAPDCRRLRVWRHLSRGGCPTPVRDGVRCERTGPHLPNGEGDERANRVLAVRWWAHSVRSSVVGPSERVCIDSNSHMLAESVQPSPLDRGVEAHPPLGSADETDMHAATTIHSVAKVETIPRRYTLPVTTRLSVTEIELRSGASSLQQQWLPPTQSRQSVRPARPRHSSRHRSKRLHRQQNTIAVVAAVARALLLGAAATVRLDHRRLRRPLPRRHRRRHQMTMTITRYPYSMARRRMLPSTRTHRALNSHRTLHLAQADHQPAVVLPTAATIRAPSKKCLAVTTAAMRV